jgi:apolipoprotein N-acyltransferase
LPADSPSCAALNFSWSNSPWFRRALALVAGALLALAFHKPNIAGLAWVAPALILFTARGGNAFRLGALAGFTHYLVSLSWLLHIPVKFYPILGWIALAAYLALFPAAWAWLCSSGQRPEVRGQHWLARTGHALFCAVAWVAMEMIVSRMFTGFPWNLLGTSQQKLLPLIQIASITGVYGVSFLVIWFAASLLNAFDALLVRPSERNVWLKELALPVFTVAVIYAFGLHRINSEPKAERTLRIALVQPSIPQTMIWNAEEAGPRLAELLKLTEAALTNKPDLLIWPEAAVPKMVRNDEPTARAITELARQHGTWFIVGSDDFELRGTNAVFFNSSFLVNPRGEFVSTYRKRRLVVFGEYVPLVDWLPFIKYLTPIDGGFTAGERPVTFDLGELRAKTSVLICFEDVFPHYAREHATGEEDFLVNITNDGWFGESAAQWQQAACAAFRAVENGVPLVRCANNGLSCWVDRFGGMHNVVFDGATDASDVYRAGFKIVNVALPSPETKAARTFYNRHGDWFGWSCAGMAAVALGLRLWQRRRVGIPN